MKNSITIQSILQSVLSQDEVNSVVKQMGYEDKTRKFSVYHLLQYWSQSAFEQWDSYRSAVDHAESRGLPTVHYSCFSTKAAEVPFAVFKELFHLLVHKCNRKTRRKLTYPKELLLIDSTTVTVGKTRLPWAPYHGERAGNQQPLNVVETVGSVQRRRTVVFDSLERQCSFGETTRLAPSGSSGLPGYPGHHESTWNEAMPIDETPSRGDVSGF